MSGSPTELLLDGGHAAVPRARAFVGDALRRREAELAADAALVVTELVTNALRHAAGSPFQLVLESEQTLRVVIVDGSALLPVARAIDADSASQESGRGLHIIGELADEWGIDDLADGKRIWVDLPFGPER